MWLFRCGLVLLPFLLLAALEVGLRLGGYGYNPNFFKRLNIGGQEFFVQNEDFSLSFFPKELVRNPGPIRFPAHKAPGTFRILIFGESAAMGDPAESCGPGRYLETLLRRRHPGRKFEVINVAFTAINSNVLLPIARECAAHQGDVWLIYMGNNEMVGPFGAATVFGRRAPPWPYVRLVTALRRLRIGQWLTELGRRFTRPHKTPPAWGGMTMFLQNQIPPASPLRETVYRNFQKNLDDIVHAGLDCGAKVVLNTVAVNLKDCPPFASVTGHRLKGADRAQFDRLCAAGVQSAAHRAFGNAVEDFERAARLDPTPAALQFRWGQCLLAQTNAAGAREHFQLACDNDALPFRADSRINAAIRAEVQKRRSPNLVLLDAAAELGSGDATGICGNETFFEHVHFDFSGRYRLARAWAEQIERWLPPSTNTWVSQQICEQMLGLSDWNRAQVIHFMVERMQLPPLSNQAGNGPRRAALEERLNRLKARMNPARSAETRALFQHQLQLRPEDYFLRENFAVFLEMTGDLAGAASQWERFRALLPQDSLGYYQAGRLLIPQQQYARAEALLRSSLSIRPSRSEAWAELGSALALQKKYAEALGVYDTALARDPQDPQTLLRRGKVLADLQRHTEAIASYRAALGLNPGAGLCHYELGLELLVIHQELEAGKEFGEAARLSPSLVGARFNYGAWLMRQGRWEAAQREFEAVLSLNPGNVRAQKNLALIGEMKHRSP